MTDRNGQIHVSLNEIDALARKAARGACLPWGIAEEVGACARRLAALGVDPVPALAELLERHHTRDDLSRGLSLGDGTHWHGDDHRPPSVLVVAPALCDHARWLTAGHVVYMNDIACPIFLLPALYRAARMAGRAITVDCDGRRWTAVPDGRVAGDFAPLADTALASGLQIRASDTPAAAGWPTTAFIGLNTTARDWERLEHIAAETFVPGSPRSRATGAGAGDIDND